MTSCFFDVFEDGGVVMAKGLEEGVELDQPSEVISHLSDGLEVALRIDVELVINVAVDRVSGSQSTDTGIKDLSTFMFLTSSEASQWIAVVDLHRYRIAW